jgi:hypothetical protein
MKVSMNLEFSQVIKNLNQTVEKAANGTKKATTFVCKRIIEKSLGQVPRNTNTLASSAFYKVEGHVRNFVGTVGYGGNDDPVNPKTGQNASQYMVVVHEDLTAFHPVGNAKFLENAVKEFQEEFPIVTAQIINEELRR